MAIGAIVLSAGDRAESALDGDMVTVHVGGNAVRAELATSRVARSRGLAGRKLLRPGQGMLFVFREAAPRSFWMRGVEYPLDMVWIRGGRVVGVTRRALPVARTGGLRLYASPGASDRVLEVPGGWAERHGIRAGDAFRE